MGIKCFPVGSRLQTFYFVYLKPQKKSFLFWVWIRALIQILPWNETVCLDLLWVIILVWIQTSLCFFSRSVWCHTDLLLITSNSLNCSEFSPFGSIFLLFGPPTRPGRSVISRRSISMQVAAAHRPICPLDCFLISAACCCHPVAARCLLFSRTDSRAVLELKQQSIIQGRRGEGREESLRCYHDYQLR